MARDRTPAGTTGLFKSMLAMAGAAAVLIVSAGPSHAACATSEFQWAFGSSASADMTASSGKRCGMNVYAAAGATIQGVRISTPPKHGSAGATASGAYYQSAPGYKGSDSFSIAVHGHSQSSNQPAIITVDVTVD